MTSLSRRLAPAALAAAVLVALSITPAADAAPKKKPVARSPARPAAKPAATNASAPVAGLDRAGMDPAARPQDDLWLAMNGGWKASTPIPADKGGYGVWDRLDDLSDERVKGVVESLAAARPANGSGRQVADYYAAWMDTKAIEDARYKPMQATFDEIDAVKTPADLAALLGRWQGRGRGPLGIDTAPDFKEPGTYAAFLWQGGLGLPDRDYYDKDGEDFQKARVAYLNYVTRLLVATQDGESTAHAAAVVALEKRLAAAQWSAEQLRDTEKVYNPMTREQLAARAPGLDWARFLDAAQVPKSAGTLVVGQPSYVEELAKAADDVPVETWRLYLKVRALDDAAWVLPQEVRDATFAFHDRAMEGSQADKPRWQRAVRSVNDALGEAVGQAYVARYFPPPAKARMQALVGNLMKAYAVSIDQLSWMSLPTRAAAHEKLKRYGLKIGYPDAWRDYATLQVIAGDAVGNLQRAGRFEYARKIVRVGQKVDRREWEMTPQTVNAYYSPQMNEIVFPAAILQPPFFDMAADDAVNYGAIGAIIGHEISHGFDDQGAKFDGDGRLRNWWTEDDRKAFDALAAKVAAQYDSYEPIPGHHVNGRLTLGEDIADLSGLQIAYKAWRLAVGGHSAPVIGGLTADQRFFLAYAQAWREVRRPELELQQLTRDPHAPSRYRAIGAPVNADAFHRAFGTKPGDGMWKAPADRIKIW